MPVMPPSSPRKMGTAKLRMTMVSTSCAAMTANAPSSPRSKNRGKVTGGSPGRWANTLPQNTNSANTKPWVRSASFVTTANFAANRSSGGTGLAMIRFQLCPRCSSRHK